MSTLFNHGFPRTTIGSWEKFWSLIKKTDTCWLWVGRQLEGYGSIYMLGKRRAPHRLMLYWMNRLDSLAHTGDRSTGMVLHTCDNKLCVNPDHLYIGSHQQNIKDAWDRGQLPRRIGHLSPCAKLSAEQVAEIRALRGLESRVKIAARFGVSKSTIDLIFAGKRYSEVVK